MNIYFESDYHFLIVPTMRQRSHRAIVIAISLSLCLSAMGAVLQEPGLLMFGYVSNLSALNNVAWQISSSSSSIAVTSTLIDVNGQNFYLATIPFETRSLGSISLGAPTPNTLPLNPAPTTYARHATVNGTNAAIVYASWGSTNAFTFGPADRGRVERVDLAVSPPPTFAQWLAQYGLPSNSNPNSDPTHKGMTLMQQYVANLNPNDPNSTFKFLAIQPTPQGVQLQWSSAAGEVYALMQGTSLTGPWNIIQSNIVATPGANAFNILMATNCTSLFFRIVVEK